jgi:hypothetical protein
MVSGAVFGWEPFLENRSASDVAVSTGKIRMIIVLQSPCRRAEVEDMKYRVTPGRGDR